MIDLRLDFELDLAAMAAPTVGLHGVKQIIQGQAFVDVNLQSRSEKKSMLQLVE